MIVKTFLIFASLLTGTIFSMNKSELVTLPYSTKKTKRFPRIYNDQLHILTVKSEKSKKKKRAAKIAALLEAKKAKEITTPEESKRETTILRREFITKQWRNECNQDLLRARPYDNCMHVLTMQQMKKSKIDSTPPAISTANISAKSIRFEEPIVSTVTIQEELVTSPWRKESNKHIRQRPYDQCMYVLNTQRKNRKVFSENADTKGLPPEKAPLAPISEFLHTVENSSGKIGNQENEIDEMESGNFPSEYGSFGAEKNPLIEEIDIIT